MRAGGHRSPIGQYGQKRFHIDHFHFTRVPCAAGLGGALANQKIDFNGCSFYHFEAIVHEINPLAHLLE
jgi:hypothetical protein